jgi:oligoendopeptidase F
VPNAAKLLTRSLSLSMIRSVLLRALTVFVISNFTSAQSPDPFDGHPNLYHADLTRYFSSSQAENDARRRLAQTTDAYLQTAPWIEDGTAARLDEGARLITDWMRHRVYCRAQASRDITDKPAKTCANEANDRYSVLLSFVDAQLQSKAMQGLSSTDIDHFGLDRYRYLIEQARETAAHGLSPQSQHIADLLTDPVLEGLTDRYDATERNLTAEPLETKDGKLDPIKDASKLAHSSDRAARKAGWEAKQQAYSVHGELFAATLIDIAREETALAKLCGFASAPARFYARRLQLTEPQVHSTLDAITQHADVLKDYQRVRAEQVSHVTGIPDVRSWDMDVSSGYDPNPLPYAQAKAVILKALAGLGPDYVAQFTWLLEPKNGALEIASGPNRESGGFSLGYSAVPVMLYMDGFHGSLTETSTVIHEGGHAIHRKLMNEVSPYYVNGPHFLFEAYAILNQLLLWDELERESTTLAEKAYYQERFLDTVSAEVFTSGEEGILEQGIYDGVAAGKINSQAEIDNLNAQILEKYELFASEEPTLRSGWMRKNLMFEDPLYLVNYLYAALVACKLYEMDMAHPADFQKQYLTMLREGFDMPAAELLKKNMGFSLDGNQLLDGALELMRDRTIQLKHTYDLMMKH